MQNVSSKLKLLYTPEGLVSILKEYHAHLQKKHNFSPLSGLKPAHALAEVMGFKSAEPLLNAISELHLVELQKPSADKHAEIERRTQYLKQMMPEYLTGEHWYDSSDFFRLLISKHYHKDVAQELCDIYRDVASSSFNRGVFAGVKQQIQVSEKENQTIKSAEHASDKILTLTIVKTNNSGVIDINTHIFKSIEAFDEHMNDTITSLMFVEHLTPKHLIDASTHILGYPIFKDISSIQGTDNTETVNNILKTIPSNIKASLLQFLSGDLTVSVQTH